MPGRSEQPLGPDGTAVNDLARRLRRLRADVKLTYDELAKRSHYSKTALQAVCSGRPPLSAAVAAAFIKACGESLETWQPYIDAAVAGRPQIGEDPSPSTGDPISDSLTPVSEVSVQSSTTDTDSRRGRTLADDPIGHRRQRIGTGLAVVGVLVIAAAAAIVLTVTHGHQTVASTRTSSTSSAPPTRTHSAERSSSNATAAEIVETVSTPASSVAPTQASALPVIARSSSPSTVGNAGPSTSAVSRPPRIEEEFARNGAMTFGTVEGGGPNGPVVRFGEKVPVLCKVLAPTMRSISPDGYWYRLGAQWGGKYYAAANTFLNGDSPTAKVFTHNTDMEVPDC